MPGNSLSRTCSNKACRSPCKFLIVLGLRVVPSRGCPRLLRSGWVCSQVTHAVVERGPSPAPCAVSPSRTATLRMLLTSTPPKKGSMWYSKRLSASFLVRSVTSLFWLQ